MNIEFLKQGSSGVETEWQGYCIWGNLEVKEMLATCREPHY